MVLWLRVCLKSLSSNQSKSYSSTTVRPTTAAKNELSRNFGEHNAVMAGLTHAAGDCAVIMDDDFQNPPSEVRRLLDALDQDWDVVYGVYEQKHHNLFRNLGSRFNGWVANILIKKPRNLYLSSFKVMKRFVIDQIILYDLPYPYIDGLIFCIHDSLE